ncbi:uncharacterized protein Z518_03718 [Rhinocladiella mackenziei CBS 650.93]|uniref:NmrA-like domain-containing protein n=1 Tax=Rhinocladiella mackenziei CBS 650.93 TaxID=1442369 RepID=A0A0D2IRF8_9EURO|nr:uncharacterized protein Z518_03718 [Rhinocladiella mackenziei CBS 650.93]KIX05746.1 hypothetical protein Z518_03718 [Rhinocladiella mackenziei CBS 650.93]
MAPVKVALAGATGNLGIPILRALLAAKYPVTVLTRKGSDNASKLPQDSNITVAEVDYSSVANLTDVLKGHTVVISTLASESVGNQTPLVDASIAAGVTRFIPSEFGSNTLNPKSAALPVFKYKVETREYLKAAAAKNPSFSYTLVINGAFFDWGLAIGFIVNPAKHSATIFNGGDVPFSTTTLATIAQAVVGVIDHLSETANRAVYVQDALVTQNQLISYVKEKDGKEWELKPKDTEELRQECFAELAKGPEANIGMAMVGFIASAIYGDGYEGDFSKFLDNELLGIKGMSEDEVKALVLSYL